MKKFFIIIMVLIAGSAVLKSQNRVVPNRPFSQLNSGTGYMTINELTFGAGLGETNVDYSKLFIGITSLHGYQIDRSFFIGAGTGFLSYNGGVLIPLYADIRYNIYISKFTWYVSGDGGLLLNVSDFNGTRMFINPQAGVRMAMSRKLAVCLALGPYSQMGPGTRDTFINVKVGVYFKPN